MNLDTVGDILITTLPIVTVGATYALTAAGIYLSNKYRNNRLIQALLVLDQIVIDVVKELNQTVVAGIKSAKADGKLSPDEANQIKQKAVDTVIKRLGVGFINIIQVSLGPVPALVGTKIEAAVFDSKVIESKNKVVKKAFNKVS